MQKKIVSKLKKLGLRFSSNPKLRSISNNESPILYPMDHYEEYFFKHKDLSKCSRIFRVKSEIDYNSNIPLVKKAINELKRIHPFLRANLYKENGNYFFRINPHQEKKKLSNIEFLFLNNTKTEEIIKFDDGKFTEISNLLMEKLLDEDIDYEKKQLWKITFLKLNSEGKHSYYYDIILTTHHSISEERCNYRLFTQLLDFIEKMHNNQYDPNKNIPYDIMPSMNEVVNLLSSKNGETPNIKNNDVCYSKPSFIKQKEAKKNSFKHPSNLTKSDLNDIKISSSDKKGDFQTIKSLIKISKKNKNKFMFNQIKCEEFNILLKKCKENNVRLACCLNLISLMALKLIYLKNGKTEQEKNRSISYSNMISLRAILNDPKLMGKTLYDNLGYYVAEQFGSNKLDFNLFDFEKSFWTVCLEENNKLNDSLKSKQFSCNTNEKNFDPENANLFIDCLVSNIGNLPCYRDNQSMHEILCTNFAGLVESKYFFCFTSFHTLNKQHGFGVFYNSHFINRDLIESYVSNFYLILNDLIRN